MQCAIYFLWYRCIQCEIVTYAEKQMSSCLSLLHGNATAYRINKRELKMSLLFWLCNSENAHKPYHNRFTALFPGPPGWAGARRELLDFMVQGVINRGRHTDHPAGRHSIRTNQCPPPPSPIFFIDWMPFLLPNQQCQSTEGNQRIWIWEKTLEFSSVLPAMSPYSTCIILWGSKHLDY